jgi:cytidylate kinase
VRRAVQAKQRAVPGRVVAEGRDIGSYVFPRAQVKVYLDAALDERARRRSRQIPEFSPEEYRGRLAERDRLDSTRADSPLAQASDAVRIDTTTLTIAEVVAKVEALVRGRLSGKKDKGGDPGSKG